ncbi:unnamed protein product [marine sediment metagenome]|uniref:Ribbon-helix-helix protein CopG domain-containing protein n=1 Tax=marine sediment metagenome TaxID=412755 RepID=X1R3W1_9ZZZZ
MKQITVEIRDDLYARVTEAILCGLAENEGDAIRKALMFYFGERRS